MTSPAFLTFDETAAALAVCKRSLEYLFSQCPRDPAVRLLLRGMSRLGKRKRFHVDAVKAAGESLKGRPWPAKRPQRAAVSP